VILQKIGREQYAAVKLVRLGLDTAWNDLHDLIGRFNVKCAVIDIRPYEDGARKFAAAERIRVALCEYTENALTGGNDGYTYDSDLMLIRAYRNGICDAMHRLIAKGNLSLPRNSDEVDEFAKQCCATAKKSETNKKTGGVTMRYVKLGDDHYRHALNYALLAATASHLPVAKTRFSAPVQERAISEYSEI